MGREVRRVPRGWQHPKDERGRYKPLFDNYAKRVRDWDRECEAWCRGERPDYFTRGEDPRFDVNTPRSFAEWDGDRPDPDDYMPTFREGTATHFCMYENTSEGTPISPVMETPEALARWLADNSASIFADATASYDRWLAIIMHGLRPASEPAEVVPPPTLWDHLTKPE